MFRHYYRVPMEILKYQVLRSTNLHLLRLQNYVDGAKVTRQSFNINHILITYKIYFSECMLMNE